MKPPIFEAGANSFEASIEGVLNGLRRLLLDAAVGDVPNGDAGDSSPSRVVYHNTLKQLVESAAFQALAGRVRIDLSSQSLAGRARGDFSALASLITLSPVTLIANDAAAQAVLDSTLQQVWGETFTQWQSDLGLSVEQRQTGAATFTDQWLADRATLLDAIVAHNVRNGDGVAYVPTLPTDRAYEFHYVDGTGVEQILIAENTARLGGNTRPVPRQQVYFGGSDNDSFTADPNNGRGARMFGGDGDDTLNGADTDDYLEGNNGNDVLRGGSGNDALVGGSGNDTLEGGYGNDWLYGGAGEDSYEFSVGHGHDVIIDADRNGRILYDGELIATTRINAEGTYRDDRFAYSVIDRGDGTRDLLIRRIGSADSITVRDWQNGSMGMSIDSQQGEDPPESRILLGDQRPQIIGVEVDVDVGPDSTRVC